MKIGDTFTNEIGTGIIIRKEKNIMKLKNVTLHWIIKYTTITEIASFFRTDTEYLLKK